MKTNRKASRGRSNNKSNPNKNICALRVASYFGQADQARYLHTIYDVIRNVRRAHTVRSIRSYVKGKTAGSIRNQLKDIKGLTHAIIYVSGHVILMDVNGNTIVDTAPRKRDARKIIKIYGVY